MISSFVLNEYACREQILQRFKNRVLQIIGNAPLYEMYDHTNLQTKEIKDEGSKCYKCYNMLQNTRHAYSNILMQKKIMHYRNWPKSTFKMFTYAAGKPPMFFIFYFLPAFI